MHKKALRILTLTLILAFVVGLCPAQTSAANTESQLLKQEVADLYRACLRSSGHYSFHGWCGSLVSWQLYLLGITTELTPANGNDHFDVYRNKEYSTGGYRARSYSAREFSLRDALNYITQNGTKDAYNIMVGFQRTNTAAGSRYGHSVLINAIVDGVVYYSESFSVNMNGTFYKEGAAITCSIDQFANYYAPWSVYEGVVHFGLKTYTESCTYFPAYLDISVTQDTELYTAPCTSDVDARSKLLRPALAGERICVTGLYQNTEGEYWYQLEDGKTAYIRADVTKLIATRYDDISVTGISAPAELRQGRAFNVQGKILSGYNRICSVRAQVFEYVEGAEQHVMSTTTPVDGQSYSLSYSTVSNELAFRLLPLGSYRYELAVVLGNYYFADGKLQTEWKTQKLWLSDFRVVNQAGQTFSVQYDANGGETNLNAAEVYAGESLGSLPEANRPGYLFDGWYTADGVRVTEDTVITESMTLTAQWLSTSEASGWFVEDGRWIYLENGEAVTGFVYSDGITYHINEEGVLDTGWVEIDGGKFYFNGNGAMHTGWMDGPDGRYYFGVNGALTGSVSIDGQRYEFTKDGVLIEE